VKPPKHVFATFPEFSRLTLSDREKWETLIADYPPIYDISFPGLMTWWDQLGSMKVAQVNNNLVISYWLPGDDENNGLSLVGRSMIDESICEIFDYLKSNGEEAKLVNVPEFVVQQIKFHDMFSIDETRRLNEYVLPLAHFYPLKNMVLHWRKRVKNYIDQKLTVTSIDMATKEGKTKLLKALQWREKNHLNDFGVIEGECMESFVSHADDLNIENLCVFLGEDLVGFCLYQVPTDKRYIIMKHIKATDPAMFGFELIAYALSKRFIEQGFQYVNLGADYDIERLRMFMVAIGAENFFRKYTITPKRSKR